MSVSPTYAYRRYMTTTMVTYSYIYCRPSKSAANPGYGYTHDDTIPVKHMHADLGNIIESEEWGYIFFDDTFSSIVLKR